MKLQGIYLPIATPFDHKGDLYPVKVQHNVERWNRTGLAGYVVCAESIYLSSEEKIRMWEWVAEYSAPEKLLIATPGMPSVHETLKLTNHAAELGYKAAWLRSSDPIYCRAVADHATIPVIADGEIEHPNILSQPIETSAAMLAKSFANGTSAAFVEFANAAPQTVINIWEAHRTREPEAAADWQNRIASAVHLTTEKYGIAGLKHAMDLNGYYGGPPRLPLNGLTPQAKQEIQQALDGIKG
jgi:4-hydroxy-2-oxoglutarate aldolase